MFSVILEILNRSAGRWTLCLLFHLSTFALGATDSDVPVDAMERLMSVAAEVQKLQEEEDPDPEQLRDLYIIIAEREADQKNHLIAAWFLCYAANQQKHVGASPSVEKPFLHTAEQIEIKRRRVSASVWE